jgi:hypothetical protein
LALGLSGPEKDEEPSGEKSLRLIQIRVAMLSLAKITPASQDKVYGDEEREASHYSPLVRFRGCGCW